MKRIISLCVALIMVFSLAGCSGKGTSSTIDSTAAKESTTIKETGTNPDSTNAAVSTEDSAAGAVNGYPYLDSTLSTKERAADLLGRMTLEEKAGQMVQGVIGDVTAADMTGLGLGSVLSGGGAVPDDNSIDAWQSMVEMYQDGAMQTRLQIPFLYGIDAVHGHSNVNGAVIFPQNIGLGAANDPALMYDMGAAVAEEMKLTHTLWNFSPCVAVAQDPRWGRVYESYSSDSMIVSSLAAAYLKGQTDHGIAATAKHYAGDGGTVFGTGEGNNLIDRGDTQLTEEQFRALHLAPYKALVDAGVKVIMASFSSFNGTKMSEDTYYLTDVLKTEFGFKGFIVSDWEATAGLSGDNFKQNVALAVNAGVDMLMEPYKYSEACSAIINGVNDGSIPQDRVDDAVGRILTVKFDMGLFEDPYMDNLKTEVDILGSAQYREIAGKLVEKSLVLIKNQDNILPLKKGQKIFVTGPAIDDIGVQCGGWTKTWQGLTDQMNGGKITEGTTILEGLKAYADANNIEIITDPNHADEADVVILAVGEIPYAEFEGDSADMSLTGTTALPGNSDAISMVYSLNKPTVTLIVAGRQVVIDEYIDEWDAVVMCYLPGTEGGGIASVHTGETGFSGKIPMPWYKDVNDIGTAGADLQFAKGYGLSY